MARLIVVARRTSHEGHSFANDAPLSGISTKSGIAGLSEAVRCGAGRCCWSGPDSVVAGAAGRTRLPPRVADARTVPSALLRQSSDGSATHTCSSPPEDHASPAVNCDSTPPSGASPVPGCDRRSGRCTPGARAHGGEPGKPSWSSWPVPDDHASMGLRPSSLGILGAAMTPRRARRPCGGRRYPGTAAWYRVNWLPCSAKAWPTIGPSTEPVRIHIAASTKLYGLVP